MWAALARPQSPDSNPPGEHQTSQNPPCCPPQAIRETLAELHSEVQSAREPVAAVRQALAAAEAFLITEPQRFDEGWGFTWSSSRSGDTAQVHRVALEEGVQQLRRAMFRLQALHADYYRQHVLPRLPGRPALAAMLANADAVLDPGGEVLGMLVQLQVRRRVWQWHGST